LVHKVLPTPSSGVDVNKVYGVDWNKLVNSAQGVSGSDPFILPVDWHTFKHSSTNVAGDLLKGDGTRYSRWAKGTALQQIRVNSGATDLEWFTPPAVAADLLPLQYTYIVYKSGSNYIAKSGLDGTILSSNTTAATVIQAVFNVFNAASGIHGLIFFKNGVYPINTMVQLGVDAFSGNFVDVIGESQGGVVLQNTLTPTLADHTMINPRCRTTWRNITFDGNNLGDADHRLHLLNFTSASPNTLWAWIYDCHFTNNFGFQVYLPGNFIVQRNVFDTARMYYEFMPCTSYSYGDVSYNVFDRTTADTTGSCLTSGTASHLNIHHNLVQKVSGSNGFAISLEAWGNYSNCKIHHNEVIGYVVVGPGGPWDADYTFRNITIENNMVKGPIQVQGRTTASFANSMKDIVIRDNDIYESWTAAIYVDKIAGPLTIQGNKTRDTNMSNTAGANFGHIEMFDCTKLWVEGNDIYMLDTSNVNRNIHGIAAWACTDGVIENNHIVNLTANPAWKDWTNNTNVVFRGRSGHITENAGATSIADGGTISHGLSGNPTVVTVTPSIASQFASVTAKGSTNFTVALKTDTGGAGTTQTVYWRASI
jgi:hypothetical protein